MTFSTKYINVKIAKKVSVTFLLFSFIAASVSSADQVDRLIKMLKDGPPKKKAFASDALAEIGNTRAIAPLIEALVTKNTYLRSYYTQAISDFGKKAVQPLLEACSHKKMRIRGNAANALGKIKDAEAVDMLISLQNDKKKFVRKSAIIALSNFTSDKIMNSQIEAIKKEKKAALRSYLVKGLATYKNKIVLPSLINASRDKDSYVRKDAVRALGTIGFPEVTDALIDALGDQDKEVRQVSAQALTILGERETVTFDSLVKNITSNTNPSVLEFAASILGKIGNIEAVPALISKLNVESTNNAFMLAAVTALGRLKDKKATDPLIKMLESFDDPIRRATVEALGLIGDKKAIEPLLPIVKDYSDYVRIQAIMVLGDFGDRRALKVLSEVAETDKKEQVRAQAKETIKRIFKNSN